MSEKKRYEYDAVLHVEPDGGAWVAFPWDLRQECGRGQAKVLAGFDGVPYRGSIVNMGVKNPDGTVCYVIGVVQAIRDRLGKGGGDTVRVTVEMTE